jgi:hypothetical protein
MEEYIIGYVEIPEDYWVTTTTVDDFNIDES